MKYFNRHEHMGDKTRKAIMESINGLWGLTRTAGQFNIMGVQNMLYGLFDGYDYSADIVNDPLMVHLQKQDALTDEYQLYSKLVDICYNVAKYPKENHDVTEH